MKIRLKGFLLTVILGIVFFSVVPVQASASYRTIGYDEKIKVGSYHVWRPYNTTFYIQKGDGKIKTLSRKTAYTINGVTNGSVLYYTVLNGKFNGKVTLYKYYLKSGKQKKITTIKNALHIEAFYKNCVYGNGASDGHSNRCIYRVNVKTKKKTVILKGYWLGKAKGRYLYVEKFSGDRAVGKYRYDLATKKMKRVNWNYLF